MLCGHTHGGQFKIPFLNWTPFAPVQDHSMVEGLHSWKKRQIHITRGVGNLWGVRLNCRPEVSYPGTIRRLNCVQGLLSRRPRRPLVS